MINTKGCTKDTVVRLSQLKKRRTEPTGSSSQQYTLCPPLATVLQNTYGGHADLYVGGEVLASREGTTQGDPLAMVMYAIGILPLIHKLQPSQAKQFWYAGDANGGGTLNNIRRWWNQLNQKGPGYRYYPNASKTWLPPSSPLRKIGRGTCLVIPVWISPLMDGGFLGPGVPQHGNIGPPVYFKCRRWLRTTSGAAVQGCNHGATCCICRLHSWSRRKMEVLIAQSLGTAWFKSDKIWTKKIHNYGKNITTTTECLSRDVTAASSWADIWGMLFNAEKCEHMMSCGRGLKGVAPQPSVSIVGIPIPQVKIHKHLGVIFNDTLTWSNHIDKVCERCAQRVGILRRLRRTFPSHVLRRIYVGAVLPIMEYACPVWSGGPVAKLIHLHDSFCRRIQTSLPPLQKRFDFHTLALFYKMRKNLTPSYLSSLMP